MTTRKDRDDKSHSSSQGGSHKSGSGSSSHSKSSSGQGGSHKSGSSQSNQSNERKQS